MSDQERLQKQIYLRDEIIQKGYDGEKFQEFLESKKENGCEIDSWTMDELKQLVSNFQQLFIQKGDGTTADSNQANSESSQYPMQSQEAQNDAQQQLESNQNNQEEVKAQQQPADQQPELELKQEIIQGIDEVIDTEVQCVKSPETDLSTTPQVSIQVRNYEKIEGGIFTSSYIVYKIVTNPFKWEVSRRFNEFYTLRDTLIKLYPAYLIPPIPKKTSRRSYQPLFIQKRMAFSERFLNKLLKCPELRACKFVEAFLKIQDPKEFSKIMKEAEKVQKVTRIDKQQSIAGTVKLQYNKSIENYLQRASEFLQNCEQIYKKMRKSSKQLILDFDQLSSTLFSFGDSFSNLYSQSNFFNKNITDGQNPLINDMYITLNNMKISWGNAITSQIQLVQDNLCNCFKFYHQEIVVAKELLKQRDHIQKEFINENKRLMQKKEKLFLQGNSQFYEISKEKLAAVDQTKLKQDKSYAFSLMLPKETQFENLLRYQNAYYSKVAFDEIQRMIADKVKEYSQHFMNFGKLQTDNITQIHILWADAMTNLTSLEGGKKMQLMENKKKQNAQLVEETVDF